MGHYIARRCAAHAYLADKSHFFIYFLVHILVGLDYLSYLCSGSFLARGLDPTFRQVWLLQVCLSYFETIRYDFVASVGSVLAIDNYHYRIEISSSYPVM